MPATHNYYPGRKKESDLPHWGHDYVPYDHGMKEGGDEVNEKENGSNSRGRYSDLLYMNRYGASKTMKNNRVHYVPNHIEMQTTIEPSKRYFKRNNGDNDASGR